MPACPCPFARKFRVNFRSFSVTVEPDGMPTARLQPERASRTRRLDMARVLIVQDELASRLTLQTILRAGGYAVDVAASVPEALAKLDERQYELVLSDMELEAPDRPGSVKLRTVERLSARNRR